YALKVNGTAVATLSARELEGGVNLTAYARSPIAAQGKEVLAAVAAKEGLVGQWRNLSRMAAAAPGPPEARQNLDALTKKVEEADAKIRAAAKPRRLRFELTPAK